MNKIYILLLILISYSCSKHSGLSDDLTRVFALTNNKQQDDAQLFLSIKGQLKDKEGKPLPNTLLSVGPGPATGISSSTRQEMQKAVRCTDYYVKHRKVKCMYYLTLNKLNKRSTCYSIYYGNLINQKQAFIGRFRVDSNALRIKFLHNFFVPDGGNRFFIFSCSAKRNDVTEEYNSEAAIEDTSAGTITDSNGNYELKLAAGQKTEISIKNPVSDIGSMTVDLSTKTTKESLNEIVQDSSKLPITTSDSVSTKVVVTVKEEVVSTGVANSDTKSSSETNTTTEIGSSALLQADSVASPTTTDSGGTIIVLPSVAYPSSNYNLSINTTLTTITPTTTGSPTSFSITPSLPTGLIFDTTNGSISGTPSIIPVETTYTVTATNTSGSSTTTISIIINSIPTVATPLFSPATGIYTSDQSVTLTTSTVGATIYYTQDGSEPTPLSNQYNSAIPVAGHGTTKTIKAIAVKNGMANSSIANASYTINYDTVAIPIFNPLSGSHSNAATNLTISTTTAGATIYYTTDGTIPTTSSNLYSIAVPTWLLVGKTVKAIAIKSGMLDSTVATLTGTFSYPPLKTGQTTIYTTGDNGTNQSGVVRGYTGPTQHSIYTNDYTTSDNATGLIWKTCTQGLSGATCGTGATVTMNWTDATSGTDGCNALNSTNSNNGYAGIKTWRLPNRQELETLPDYGKLASPLIDTTAFPATVATIYWSSTQYDASNGWAVLFDVGSVLSYPKINLYPVRCVSGQSREYSNNFTDNGDGTIKDNATGLIWQKCSKGQNNDSTCSGTATTSNWATALTDCSGLTLVGKTWRLPTINELKSIIDTTKSSAPFIDTTTFPATISANYWSSTTYSLNAAKKWNVTFSFAGVINNTNTGLYSVRCVSGP